MRFRIPHIPHITFERPKRAWPYVALATIVYTDALGFAALPNGYPWATVVFLTALTLAKTAMAGFIMEYGFRTSMDEWKKKRERERQRDWAQFVHRLEQMRAEGDEIHQRYMADWHRLDGEGWKNGEAP